MGVKTSEVEDRSGEMDEEVLSNITNPRAPSIIGTNKAMRSSRPTIREIVMRTIMAKEGAGASEEEEEPLEEAEVAQMLGGPAEDH